VTKLAKNWRLSTLGEIAELSSGFGFPKHAQGKTSGEYPFAKVRDITNAVNIDNGVLSSASNYVDKADLATLRAKPIPPGSTVFAKIGEALHLNRRAITVNSIILDNNCMALSPRVGVVDPRYLYHYMRTVNLSPLAVATSVPSVRKGDVSAIGIPIPPLDEQHRIVAKLEDVSTRARSARNELARVNHLSERCKAAVLAAAFRGQLTGSQQGKTRWESTLLGELAIEIRYGTAAKCHYEPRDTPVLRIPNIVEGRINGGDLKFGSFDQNETRKLALRSGDLLIIRSNGTVGLVGRAALVTEEFAGYLFAGYLIRLRLDEARVRPSFLQLAFEEPSIRASIERLAKSTSGVNNINSEQIRSIKIPLPSLSEQDEILACLTAALDRIDHLSREATRAAALLNRLDEAVLSKAFRGDQVSN
jgi:type I restriction enzyme S subunit